jgi:hypothetical protein
MGTTTVETSAAEVLRNVEAAQDRGQLEPHQPRQTLSRSNQSPGMTQGAQPVAPQIVGTSSPMEEMGPLFGALAKAQGAFGRIERTLTARIQSRKGEGSSFTYDYAPLSEVMDAVRPALAANELALSHFPATRLGGSATAVTVRTLLAHSSGKAMWCDITLASVTNEPKDIGSAITYASRYAVMALLGVSPDYDDDGAAASGREQVTTPRGQPAPQPAKAKGGEKEKVAAIQAGKVANEQAWKVKTSAGRDVYTSDQMMVDALRRALQDGTPVTLVTESREIAKRTYTWLVEIA